MKPKQRLVFFGNERLVSGLSHTDAPVLGALLNAGYDVAAVVCNDAGTRSRKQKVLEVAALAEANGIPVYMPARPMDIADQLAALKADAGILVAYGRIVPQALIDLFPFGIINVHPSLLPKYRGPSPIESAIASGDDTTGVSIMSLSAQMDAGPVYHQVKVDLSSDDTAPHLAAKLSLQAASDLIAALPSIFDGSLMPTPQDDSQATYCQLISKENARLRPLEQTAEQAERLVRAYLAYPRVRISIHSHDLIILSAHVSSTTEHALSVRFADGSYLTIDELIAPSGKTMTATAFIKGYVA